MGGGGGGAWIRCASAGRQAASDTAGWGEWASTWPQVELGRRGGGSKVMGVTTGGSLNNELAPFTHRVNYRTMVLARKLLVSAPLLYGLNDHCIQATISKLAFVSSSLYPVVIPFGSFYKLK